MNLTRAILSTCAVASSIVCISAYSVASSEPSVNFTVAKPCSQESAPKPKMEILEPLGPLHDIAEPDILEAFKSRVGAMKAVRWNTIAVSTKTKIVLLENWNTRHRLQD